MPAQPGGAAPDDLGRSSPATSRLTSVVGPFGHSSAVECDRTGLPIRITNPRGAVTRYRRDPLGHPVEVTEPSSATTLLEWTVEGLLTRRTAADGAAGSWTYDGEGNRTSHTDRLGGTTRYEYTHFDVLVGRTGPDGGRHEFTYDEELRLTEVTNPQGTSWSYSYDPAGRPQAPKANAICERVMGTLRRRLLDRMLIYNEAHARAVLAEYIRHYNGHRLHQSRQQLPPDSAEPATLATPATVTNLQAHRIRRQRLLRGLINQYEGTA
ncbi:integrase core domain-containing protein [Streptomyces sp. NPDC056240]|uniref:integrase core domain-containing protein n=1 Tax=Streptomyces sp. NPDC056240 TaxID=3345759 RepID=UPI0035DF6780